MAVVPINGEGFRLRYNGGEDPSTHTSWHGSALRLSVPDGAVAYGHIGAVVDSAAAVAYLPAFAMPELAIIYAQVRFPNGEGGTVGVGIHRGNTATTITGGRSWTFEIPEGGAWHMVTSVIRMTDLPEYPLFVSAALAGTVFLYATTTVFDGTQPALDVSYLAFGPARPQPLQWRQHDFAGLSARSSTSFWRTNRARGML